MKKLFITLLSAFLLAGNSVVNGQGVNDKKSDYIGISPLPQQVVQGEMAFTLPAKFEVKNAGKADADAMEALLKRVSTLGSSSTRVRVIIGKSGDSALKQYEAKIPTQAEGYYLSIKPTEVIIAGRDAEGTFYGVQSFLQLLQQPQVQQVEISDYPSVSCRGVIEGFYGNPWSHEDRLRQFDFYGKFKMNTYVYGPKDDPYHRRYWRQPYPAAEAAQISELVRSAHHNKVQFVWAIHPGLDIQWNKQDSLAIVAKLESVYKLGVRTFAVFFDDIGGEGTRADKQANLMNYITDAFVHRHKDVQPLILCPTQYNKSWSHGDYLNTLGTVMYPEVRIMWTGNSVVDMIEMNDMQWINGQINRKAFIWLNYPVNDYCQSRMLMGKTYGNGKDIAHMLSGFCSNPMEYAEASKVSLYSIADYTWNMEAYNEQESWERSLSEIMPTTTAAFKVFCENNIDLGVTGHGLRREGESADFFPFTDIIKMGYKYMNLDELQRQFRTLVSAAEDIASSKDNPNLLNEIGPWVETMRLLGLRGKILASAAKALDRNDSISFVNLYKISRELEAEQKKIISRNYEGSIVKAHPAISGDVITPFLADMASELGAIYRSRYTIGWDIFPHGVLDDGNYHIIFEGKYLTDSIASPTRTGDFPVFLAERDTINPQRQLWHLSYNEKDDTYNITNVQDGRYINEVGAFWKNAQQNPFDPTYHSFIIEKEGDKYAIRQTGRGGSAYFNSNGRRLVTGNKNPNFIFKIE